MVEERVLPLDVGAHPLPGGLAGRREEGDAAAEHVDRAVALEPLDLEQEPLRERHVVGVHPRDERGAGLGERQGERGDEPARRRAQDPQARVLPRPGEEPLAAAVARAVVDRDHLVVGEGLGGERVEAGAERRDRVADRQQHRDAGHGL